MAWEWRQIAVDLPYEEFVAALNVRMRRLMQQIAALLASTTSVNTFINGATLPSVFGSRVWKTANTVATNITGFDEGSEGQEILVWSTDVNTTFVHSAGLLMKGGVNVTMTATETRRFDTVDGINWRET